ncbi:MAG: hypothetical protein Phog2KO_38440 [Phototrophicaceae bacterium]
MGVYITGWFEVLDFSKKWCGVIRVDQTLLNYAGKSGYAMQNLYELAESKPLPSDFSTETIDSFGIDDYVGIPHVVYLKKFALIDWNEISNEWYFLYDILHVLATYHGDENVRLVFWSG